MTVELKDVVKKCTPFVLACYGEKDTNSANDARHNVWMKKMSKNVANAPKLQSLQSTYKALCQKVARVHIQAAAWRNSLVPNSPALDQAAHGWYIDLYSILLLLRR